MKNYIKLLLFASVLLISSCSLISRENNGLPLGKEITKELCNSGGGNWNDCSSPCIGTDAEMCIEVCVAQCECGGIAGFNCPEGYKCRLSGKIADEMGACISE